MKSATSDTEMTPAFGDGLSGMKDDSGDTPFGAGTPSSSMAMPDAGLGIPGFMASVPDMRLAANPKFAANMPKSVLKIPVAIQVVIGSARVPLSQVAQLGPGSMITLDQKLGAPALILVNGKEVAKGELFVLDGEGSRLGITITEVTGSGGNAAD